MNTTILPPILALKATPTPHIELLAAAAASPAHRVPWLENYRLYKFDKSSKRVFIEIFFWSSYPRKL